MTTHSTKQLMAHDDTGGAGQLVVLLPGAGDVRSEHRFLSARLADAGLRVVTADLPGHGESPVAADYTMESTAHALLDLIEALDAGPAVVVAASFAPTAAIWAAADRPERVAGVVAISPHLHADNSLVGRVQGLAMHLLLRGPWAGNIWARLYRGWYKANPPADLEDELSKLRAMFSDPGRRAAARATLTASRDGIDVKIERSSAPTLTVFGSADDHFRDPAQAGTETAETLDGELLMVEGAGHYPHVEQPTAVAEAIVRFIERLA